jgi:copper chaperone
MAEIRFDVPDIHCGHCKMSIEDAVAAVTGVETVDVTIDARTVDVVYDGSDETRAAVVQAIESQGYLVAT